MGGGGGRGKDVVSSLNQCLTEAGEWGGEGGKGELGDATRSERHMVRLIVNIMVRCTAKKASSLLPCVQSDRRIHTIHYIRNKESHYKYKERWCGKPRSTVTNRDESSNYEAALRA